jgi:hypothetical protein
MLTKMIVIKSSLMEIKNACIFKDHSLPICVKGPVCFYPEGLGFLKQA